MGTAKQGKCKDRYNYGYGRVWPKNWLGGFALARFETETISKMHIIKFQNKTTMMKTGTVENSK